VSILAAHPKGGSEAMDNLTFRTRLQELIDEIEKLPPNQKEALKNLAAKTEAKHEELAATAKSVTEALDYLRLQIKYIVFDLEATRRENRYLRKMLESRPSQDIDPGGDPLA